MGNVALVLTAVGVVLLCYIIVGFTIAPWYVARADEVYAAAHGGKHFDENSRALIQAFAAVMWIFLVPRELRSDFGRWQGPNIPLPGNHQC